MRRRTALFIVLAASFACAAPASAQAPIQLALFSPMQIFPPETSIHGDVEGFTLGLVNLTEEMSGFALGLVNYAQRLHGVQVGLVNIAANGVLPVMPIVNWAFD